MSEFINFARINLPGVMDVDDDSTENSDPTKTPASEIAEGMQCDYKSLYAGPEDKHGRFKWFDKAPKDIGKAVEDAETAKFALIVRMQRVFNDPRKVMKLHSIVVQSPLLKELLGRVLRGYPGVTTTLQRLTFSGRFEPFVHRWVQFKEAVSTEANESTKQHAQLLLGVLEKEFKETIEESLDLKANKVITFDLLWTLFLPGELVYTRLDGQERAAKPLYAQYCRDDDGNPIFSLVCQYVDFGDDRFGTQKIIIKLPRFNGTLQITQLRAYPIVLHPHCEELKARLIERASRVEALAGVHYKAYKGIAWIRNEFNQKELVDLNERIVIDAGSFNKNKPNMAVHVTSFRNSEKPGLLLGASKMADNEGNNEDAGAALDDGDDDEEFIEEAIGDMPVDGHFADDDGEYRRKRPLTEEQKLLCSPLVRGYAMSCKAWLNFFINCVHEIEWDEDAFSSLVLPANQKELILGFTESQNKSKDTFDDVIQGKGKGIIMLLCGPPGVGKTLTAESVAEEMRIPLYAMSAGDLGLDPRNVERTLKDKLAMCAKWKAVLLIDEADVFLEQRSLHELERNKLVSIFLRVLEYYQGIMFLTTNRVNTFDAAFASRIHISLDYPDLTAESRRAVWKNFLALAARPAKPLLPFNPSAAARLESEDDVVSLPSTPDTDAPQAAKTMQHTITDSQLDRLADMDLNGRQIKNVLKTARLLASRKEVKLSFEHIKTVLDVTQHLHNMTKETDKQRSAIFC